MQLLDDVKGKLIKGITVRTTPDQINLDVRDLLKKYALKKEDQRQGGTLAFRIYDPTINREVMMASGVKIPVEREFVDELKRIDNVEFKVEHV